MAGEAEQNPSRWKSKTSFLFLYPIRSKSFRCVSRSVKAYYAFSIVTRLVGISSPSSLSIQVFPQEHFFFINSCWVSRKYRVIFLYLSPVKDDVKPPTFRFNTTPPQPKRNMVKLTQIFSRKLKEIFVEKRHQEGWIFVAGFPKISLNEAMFVSDSQKSVFSKKKMSRVA